jgi:hypothetical protein
MVFQKSEESIVKNSFEPVPGDEPIIEGTAIHQTWANTWPKVIARVWREESCGITTEWYEDLFSYDPMRVLNALIAEGFIRNMTSKDSKVISDQLGINPDGNLSDEISEEQMLKLISWLNVQIIIKRREDGINVVQGSDLKEFEAVASEKSDTNYKFDEFGYAPANGWKDVDRLKHFLVFTIPPKPVLKDDFAVAIADYQASGHVYPFTMC